MKSAKKIEFDYKSVFSSTLPYAVAMLLTTVIVLIIYAVNGIYPFGSGSVVCDDMVQQTISNYTYFWDYLHSGGSKSLLFNWQTAAGTQVLTTGFYILKPWEIVFTLLCSRDAIVNGIPLLIIFKMSMASASMVFFLKREFKINVFWQTMLSISYGMSAFIIIYYTNMGWIDAAFMFPFLAAALLHMFRTGKWMPYFLLVTYTLMLSIYIAYMVFLFLFFAGFLYLAIIQPKETRKMSIIRFGVTSVLGIFASAVINLPSVYYMFRSTRYTIKSEESTLDSILKIFRTDTTYSLTKISLLLLCTAVFMAFFILLFVNFKNNKKACAFFGISALFLILPVFVESINLIWHLGSYVSFPLRYFYLTIFVLVTMAAYVIEHCGKSMNSIKGFKNIFVIIPAAACAFGGIYLLIAKVYNEVSNVTGLKYNKLIATSGGKWMFFAFMLLALFYILAMFIGIKKLSYISIALVMITEIGLLANVSFGTNSYGKNSDTSKRSAMYSLDFVYDSLEMAEDLQLESNNLTRIKDYEVRLNSNFPMFFGYPSLSNFTHLVSSDMTSTMASLGYSQIYTRVIDSVGTQLSDALLNMKYTFSNKNLDSYEYTYLRDIGSSKLYASNMTLPEGLIVSQNFMDIDSVENDDIFETNNQLYTALTGDTDKLCETEVFKFDFENDLSETIHVDGTRHLYLNIGSKDTDKYRGAVTVVINGELADLSYFGDDKNYRFPNNFHNGLIDLGVVTDDDIQIDIFAIKDIGKDVEVTVGFFDYTKLEKLCEINKDNHAEIETGAKSLTATYTSENGGDYVFIPVTYDEGWTCTVNGEKQDIDIALSSFMAIKLQKGENVIELSYLPYGMNLGAIITVLTSLAVLAIYIIEKKKQFNQSASNLFLRVFEKVYYVGMLTAIAIVYLIPVIYTIYSNIN